MIWILQQNSFVVGFLTVLIVVLLALAGLLVFRRLVPQRPLKNSSFALEHPFVGSLAVKPDPYIHVLENWSR